MGINSQTVGEERRHHIQSAVSRKITECKATNPQRLHFFSFKCVNWHSTTSSAFVIPPLPNSACDRCMSYSNSPPISSSAPPRTPPPMDQGCLWNCSRSESTTLTNSLCEPVGPTVTLGHDRRGHARMVGGFGFTPNPHHRPRTTARRVVGRRESPLAYRDPDVVPLVSITCVRSMFRKRTIRSVSCRISHFIKELAVDLPPCTPKDSKTRRSFRGSGRDSESTSCDTF